MSPQRAVVFAYHNVGVRGLSALLALGLDVRLVVTHEDSPGETLWFQSVKDLAEADGLPIIFPVDPNTPEVLQQVCACAPDWLFSFYYRRLLGGDLLQVPSRGAYNLHGSLLPKYRGRAPVNWAVLHGESRTGASLHRMADRPDAGALVDQQAVRILPNDTACDVFHKVTCAAEEVLLRTVPKMMVGSHMERPLDLGSGSYFGRRRPEDGRIDWARSAWEVHNLVRAVAPPYPGAFTDIGGTRLMLLGSRFKQEGAAGPSPAIYWESGACYADCADGRRFRITRIAASGEDLDRQRFVESFGSDRLPVGSQQRGARPSTP